MSTLLVEPRPYSPAWWREAITARLDARQVDIVRLQHYYDGEHGLHLGTPLFNSTFQRVFEGFSDNWMALVVDSSVERLRVQGFRFGEDADEDAWNIWQFNQLDLHSRIAHTEAIKLGTAYLLVVPPGDDDHARITVEHPSQCFVVRDPADRRKRLAGVKRWMEPDGRHFLTLYLPDSIHRWQSMSTDTVAYPYSGGLGAADDWEPREDADPPVVRNPLGVVPLIPLENNPGLLGGGRSDLDPLTAIQDAINKTVADALVASEYSALRQRWGTGLEVPKDAQGQPLQTAQVDATFKRLWIAENPDAKWGEFSTADLNGYTAMVGMLTQHLGGPVADAAALSARPDRQRVGGRAEDGGGDAGREGQGEDGRLRGAVGGGDRARVPLPGRRHPR